MAHAVLVESHVSLKLAGKTEQNVPLVFKVKLPIAILVNGDPKASFQ